mgnify:CR=1 FL=1
MMDVGVLMRLVLIHIVHHHRLLKRTRRRRHWIDSVRTWRIWCDNWLWLSCAILVTLFQVSAVDVACIIYELNFLCLFFVVPDELVVIEWVSNPIDFAIKAFFDLLLGIDCPELLQFPSLLKINGASKLSITATLMHGSNSIDVELLSNFSQTTGVAYQFSHQLFAVVEINKVHFELRNE